MTRPGLRFDDRDQRRDALAVTEHPDRPLDDASERLDPAVLEQQLLMRSSCSEKEQIDPARYSAMAVAAPFL